MPGLLDLLKPPAPLRQAATDIGLHGPVLGSLLALARNPQVVENLRQVVPAGLREIVPLLGGEAGIIGPFEKAGQMYPALVKGAKPLTPLLDKIGDRLKSAIYEAAPHGSAVTPPARTYNEGTGNKGNVWVRQAAGKDNSDRTLLVQWSNDLINPKSAAAGPQSRADAYYDKLYQSRAGYDRPHDFWEIPQWQANIAHNLPNTDVYVVRNPQEAVKFANSAGYKNVAFSALDVNKPMIRDFAEQYKGNVVVGGYGELDKAFKDLPNVKVYPTVKEFVASEGEKFTPGYDYRHYSGTKTVPRLTMSDGCLHQCAFCTIPKKVVEHSRESIMQQADAFAKDLPSTLVYVNDKTFGQAKNHTLLPEVYQRIKAQNPDFQGFVIQTTAAQMKKMDPGFLKDAGIKYAELGIESFNDPVLRAAKKPASEAIIDAAADKLRSANVTMIPNIMVGLPGETRATYNRTLNWLDRNSDNISHVNAYNLAVYDEAPISKALKSTTEADRNENVIAKSWMTDPAAHTEFNEKVMDFGSKQLDKTPQPIKQTFTTIGGQGIAPELKQGPQLGELLNPPPPTPKGVKYNGYQEGYGPTPGFHMFTDSKTGSTFGVKAGEDVEAQLAASRAKFAPATPKIVDLNALGSESALEDATHGWITPEGKILNLKNSDAVHADSITKAMGEKSNLGWRKKAAEQGLTRFDFGSAIGPSAEFFSHPTDAQIDVLRNAEKFYNMPVQFDLTHPHIGRSGAVMGGGSGVNQIRRTIQDIDYKPFKSELPETGSFTKPTTSELLQPEQPFVPSLMDLLQPPQLSPFVGEYTNA